MVDRSVVVLIVISLAVGVVLVASFMTPASGSVANLPDPAVDESLSRNGNERSVVVAGGCFWGIEAVFQHVKGVKSATSGYAGGAAEAAHYELVSDGDTGHAESVKIVYDPSQITLGQLLKVFFAVAHDPTQLNRQGPDIGTQYRSAIFFADAEQQRIATAYIGQLDQAKAFPKPIVTQIAQLKAFYPAEDYHQDYARLHPEDPYIVHHDAPKVAALQKQFPQLFVAK